jgi:hypothetical protein
MGCNADLLNVSTFETGSRQPKIDAKFSRKMGKKITASNIRKESCMTIAFND